MATLYNAINEDIGKLPGLLNYLSQEGFCITAILPARYDDLGTHGIVLSSVVVVAEKSDVAEDTVGVPSRGITVDPAVV